MGRTRHFSCLSRWKRSKDLYAEKWRERKQQGVEASPILSEKKVDKMEPLAEDTGILEDIDEAKPFSDGTGRLRCSCNAGKHTFVAMCIVFHHCLSETLLHRNDSLGDAHVCHWYDPNSF